MRRALAAAVLGISLWIGSLAWTGFILTRTVLDPGRSEAVADTLLDDEDVRAQLVENMADAAEAATPAGAGVDRAQYEQAAATALDSPEVEAVVRSAFVETHQAFLGEGDPPASLDSGAFGAAARDALVDSRPELDGVLPAAPELNVRLPTERVPDLGPVRRALDTAVPLLAGVAAFGVLVSLIVTSNRPAILRRAGIWAVALSLFVLAFAYGIPALAQRLLPDQASVVAALVGAMAAASRGPALVLAGAGLAGILLSLVWRPAGRAMAAPPPASPRPISRPRRSAPAPHPRQPRVRRQRAAPSAAPPRHAQGGTPPRRPAPTQVRAPEPTQVRPPAPPSPPPAPAQPSPSPRPSTPGHEPTVVEGRRWVEGVGWVVHGGDHIPDHARWVAGVGYVVDE